ncbi:hypothetical protein F5J12DRAFT_905481 [Pisolithus orientalis]|uniref:uncharacterized protein n=1 Tax=Pisolithus orientalis TaxID=936130 RepID=UPI0022256088|nr:uncharacterized protein F5J12DRAFT_905481 [Pisolithus orientalis]KAI6007567.1 hypothetical protein F5J12DRAFT_905481 [Pisolithus orientalis]
MTAYVKDGSSLASDRCFIEQYTGSAAQILGSHATAFKEMERTEQKNNNNQWAPFQNKNKWDLACFLMKNMGQTRINEFLKLSLVHESGVNFSSAYTVTEDGSWRWEQVELWHRDPVKCVMELISNLAFQDAMAYIPEHAYMDSNGTNCIYDEMWTADWWWDVQGKLLASATVTPVILLSDKTSLLMFISTHVMTLIGYLPISKLKCFEKKTQSLVGYCLFHHAICNGEVMICTDGCLHQVHPILTAYVADFPEQCLVACSKESQCLLCLNGHSRRFDDEGFHAVFEPFWKDLPFTNIFTCITPNILHQLLKGVFHDHLLQWFSQWTSREHKEMQGVFIGLLSGAVDEHVLVVSLLDFFYYAQLQQHTGKTLKTMQDSLDSFHNHKHVLIKLKVQEDFNNLAYLEHLNIDYTKDAYQASNKHDYLEQMALWLQQQEAIHYKSTYLAWRQLQNYQTIPTTE